MSPSTCSSPAPTRNVFRSFINVFRKKDRTPSTEKPLSSSKSSKKASKTTTPTKRTGIQEIKIAKTFYDAIADADMTKLESVTHKDCRMLFPDMEIIPANIAEETIKLAKAFPDSHFVYEKVYLKEPNVVYMKIHWAGTHTGAPYGFGPYDEIPVTGKFVVNDPEIIHVYFSEDNKQIIKIIVEPTGPNTGFHGVYNFIGGLIF